MPILQCLNCLETTSPPPSPSPPLEKRWFEDLTINVLFAEDLTTEAGEPKGWTTIKPPRFYVEAWIQGQKLRINQKTDEKGAAIKTETGFCVEWYCPMKFKICIQSLFQNPTLEFRVFQVTEINRKLVDKEFGEVSVSLKRLYDHPSSDSLIRLNITPRFGRFSKGVLCITKASN